MTLAIMRRLADARVAAWLFGGWAEELRGLCLPRNHHDVDLLYPAATFADLDSWLTTAIDLRVFPAKHFSHTRALLYDAIMVELLLLEPQPTGFRTIFCDGAFQLAWPVSTLGELVVAGLCGSW